MVEGGLVYDGEFGGVGVLASVVGLYGELVNGGEDDVRRRQVVRRAGRCLASTCSASSWPAATATTRSASCKNQFFTAGIGAALGPVNTSVTYGQIIDTNSDFDEATGIGDSAYNLVFSADVAMAPGLVLAGDVSVVRQRPDRLGRRPARATRAGPRSAASRLSF